MQRRKFIEYLGWSTSILGIWPWLYRSDSDHILIPKRTEGKLLNAYYFRAHMYTMVPKQVREDLKWMASIGTKAVSIAVLEQDLWAAEENIHFIIRTAKEFGMETFAVPSRWAGLVAGSPKVPSHFSVRHPDIWVKKPNGEIRFNKANGVICSIHAPETKAFFKTQSEKMLRMFDFKSVIWDEPKLFDVMDYSDLARKKLKDINNEKEHQQAFADFWSEVNIYIKEEFPSVSTHMFCYANLSQQVIDIASKIEGLDYFGCDGRPWGTQDIGQEEQKGKVLLGNGERFIKAAHKQEKKSLWLIENHNMDIKDNSLMDKRLPEVIEKAPEHLIYYYYPRNLAKPEENMSILSKYLPQYLKSE